MGVFSRSNPARASVDLTSGVNCSAKERIPVASTPPNVMVGATAGEDVSGTDMNSKACARGEEEESAMVTKNEELLSTQQSAQVRTRENKERKKLIYSCSAPGKLDPGKAGQSNCLTCLRNGENQAVVILYSILSIPILLFSIYFYSRNSIGLLTRRTQCAFLY